MLEATLRRDRAVAAAGVLGVAALGWAYVVHLASPPAHVGMAMAMPGMAGAEPGLGWLVGMWAVMMVAMMLPSAAPTILLFAGVSRRRRLEGRPAVPAAVFTLGYLLVWMLYAAAATARWELHRLALLSPAMATQALLRQPAGRRRRLWWLPLKAHTCRLPFAARTFSTEWRERGGAVDGHAAWHLLRGLLLAPGAAVRGRRHEPAVGGDVAAFVLVEKLVPGGERLGRLAGLLLICWGVWLLGIRGLA
jgi:predicted metal-binding membrane protein